MVTRRWIMRRLTDGTWLVSDPECDHNLEPGITCGGSVSCGCQSYGRRSAATAADYLQTMQLADDLELMMAGEL